MYENFNYNLTPEELDLEIRALHFEMSTMHGRLIKAFELIEELSELVEEVSTHLAETTEIVFEQSTRQSRLRDDFKKRNK